MDRFDLLIVGGGINGAAIARAAAYRGLGVLLVEKDDLASHTSSASSKLIHGGLRYLEYFEFRLVREALKERERLLAGAPHIVRPLPFILPHCPEMRPWWMVRAGLGLYDLLAWGSSLPRARRARTTEQAFHAPLKRHRRSRLAQYWDAWVDDARLVVLNAVDASEHGAEIATRTELLAARREEDVWRCALSGGREVAASAIVNAGGPWVAEILSDRLRANSSSGVRLVKGSHIVVPRLYEGEHAYILQQPDGRVIFAIPYEGRFTLIGTTDIPVTSAADAVVGREEVDYLCAAADRYFEREIAAQDVVWSYSGIRSLHDDGSASAQAVTRDYHLELDGQPGPKLLSVFGGKITTARALADEALRTLGARGGASTARALLPGGEMNDMSDDSFEKLLADLSTWMPEDLLARLAGAYGGRLAQLVTGAASVEQLGRHFGSGLYEAEVRYLLEQEFARTAEDIVWRRTKLGLHMSAAEQEALSAYLGA